MDAALEAVPELTADDRRKLHNCAWLAAIFRGGGVFRECLEL